MNIRPYRIRTLLRGKTPWFLINLGVFKKGIDCEAVGGIHEWCRLDDEVDICLHCRQNRPFNAEWWERWAKKYGTKDNFGLINECDSFTFNQIPIKHQTSTFDIKENAPNGDIITSIDDAPWAAIEVRRWLIKTWGTMDVTIYLDAFLAARGYRSVPKRSYPNTFVFLRAETPIGTVSIVEDEILEAPQLNPWVTCLYVSKRFRRQGVAKDLLNYACRFASKRGGEYIFAIQERGSNHHLGSGWEELSDSLYLDGSMKVLRKKIVATNRSDCAT